MFDASNRKGMEAVVHFLLTTLDAARAAVEFKMCWPVLDKSQETVFRKTAGAWITQIGDAKPEAAIPKLVPSLLASPSGKKTRKNEGKKERKKEGKKERKKERKMGPRNEEMHPKGLGGFLLKSFGFLSQDPSSTSSCFTFPALSFATN